VRQQDAYRQTWGAVKTTCNIPAPFSRASSLSLIICLYAAYSKLGLLQLTAASIAGVYETLAIIDEYLVDRGWMLARACSPFGRPS